VLIALALGNIAQRGGQVRSGLIRKLAGTTPRTGQVAVVAYLAVVAAAFLYWSAILYGFRVPESFYQSIMWLPSWK